MVVNKGFPNRMHVKVNEISQNTVSSNGQKDTSFKIYYSQAQPFVDNIPYRVNQTSKGGVLFEAYVEFEFDWNYSYNNHKASFIDCFTKFAFVFVFTYLVILLVKLFIRHQFYRELRGTIKKVDQEVHMQAGILP